MRKTYSYHSVVFIVCKYITKNFQFQNFCNKMFIDTSKYRHIIQLPLKMPYGSLFLYI